MIRFSLPLAAIAATLIASSAFAAPQINAAPTHQTATSTAASFLGSASALSLNNNNIQQGNFSDGRHGPQVNIAPTSQSASSGAFALGGDADATSVNTNLITQGNGALSGGVRQVNRAPTVQSATSTAVSVG